MADYSYVEITVENQGDAFKAILDEIEEEHGKLWDEAYGDNTLYSVAFDQARYGFPEGDDLGDDDVRLVIDALMAAGIPWWGQDSGGTEWGEAQFAWGPGMDQPAKRYGGSYNSYLTSGQFEKLLPDEMRNLEGDLATEIVLRILAHFGDDPRGWL